MTLDHSIIRLNANPLGFGEVADELTQDMFVSDLPIQHSHDYFADEDLGIYIGVWDTTDMKEAAGPYEFDEFMVVLEGSAQIKNNKTEEIETIVAGESFIIPKGYDCQWIQEGYLRKFYVISEGTEIDNTQSIEHSSVVKLSNDTQASSQVSYQNTSGDFTSGIFKGKLESSPIVTCNQHRFIYLKQGEITLIDHNLTEHQFNEGDAFIILNGAQLGCRSDQEIIHHLSLIHI